MLEASLLIAVLICGMLALHASDTARRARAELRSLQEDSRADALRLHETLAQQEDRLQRMMKSMAEVKAEVEAAHAAVATVAVPPPPEDLPTPRAQPR